MSDVKLKSTFGGDVGAIKIQNGFYQKREIMKLPPSAKFIIYLLKVKGALNRKKIIEETMMPDRTVGFALKKLLEKHFIHKVDLESSTQRSFQQKRRRRRRDRRITNYNLVSTILPFNMANF